MKQALLLLALSLLALELGKAAAGYRAVVELAYGTVAIMSVMISATFLWLWRERATPLALGMSFSWMGAGAFAGGIWLVALFDMPLGLTGEDAVLGVLAIYMVGAFLHFAVINRSFGRHGQEYLWPVLAALAVSALGAALAPL